MLPARSGFSRGFNSASGKISASVLSVGCDTGTLLRRTTYDCTTASEGCQSGASAVPEDDANPAKSVAYLAISGLELVQLSIPLRGNSPLCGLSIQIRARAVVQRSVEINPDLCIRITLVFGRVRRVRYTQADQ